MPGPKPKGSLPVTRVVSTKLDEPDLIKLDLYVDLYRVPRSVLVRQIVQAWLHADQAIRPQRRAG